VDETATMQGTHHTGGQPIHRQQAGCREIFASISPRRNEIAFRMYIHSRSTHEALAGTLDASIRRELACRSSCLLHRPAVQPLIPSRSYQAFDPLSASCHLPTRPIRGKRTIEKDILIYNAVGSAQLRESAGSYHC